MQLEPSLLRLESGDLIRRLHETDPAFLFKQSLVQDTVRESLLHHERKRLHRLVGQALEELYPERRVELASLLCQHFSAGGDDDKALEYAALAGDAAARINANTEAVAHYTRAIRVAEQPGRPGALVQELYLKRGRALELGNDFAAALENYDALTELAFRRNDRHMELAALMAKGTIRSIPTTAYDMDLASVLNDNALDLARQLGDKSAEATILWNRMLMESRVGTSFYTALAYGEEALRIARENNLTERIAYLLNDISPLLVFKGQAELGERYNLEARDMWIEFQNLPMLTSNLGYAVMIHLAAGKYDLAIQESQQALRISREIDNKWNEAFSQAWVGEAYLERGDIATAERVMLEAIALGKEYFPPTLVMTRSDLARLYTELGFPERGAQLANQALEVASAKFLAIRSVAIGALADASLEMGILEPVRKMLPEKIELTDFIGNPLFGIDVARSKIRLQLFDHDYQGALTETSKLLEFLFKNSIRQMQPNLLLLRARALSSLDRVPEAADDLYLALDIAQAMAAQWTLWQIFAALSRLEARRGNLELAADFRAHTQTLIASIAERTPEEYRARLRARAAREL